MNGSLAGDQDHYCILSLGHDRQVHVSDRRSGGRVVWGIDNTVLMAAIEFPPSTWHIVELDEYVKSLVDHFGA